MASHDFARERAPLPGVRGCSHVWRQDMSQAADPRASSHGRRCAGRSLAGRPPFDGSAYCPGSGCVLEEPLTVLSWPKESAH